MERGRKAVGSPAYLEAKRRLEKLRELSDKVTPTEAGKLVGCSRAYATKVRDGERGADFKEALTIAGLDLRRSSKLCRGCGDEAVIVTMSGRCVVCELLELAKQGLITIAPEEVLS